jgi:hypothetical protein
MTPKAITSAFTAAQALFFPIDGQPSDDNLVHLSDAILPILLKATYDHGNGVQNLWGLVANADRYLHHYGAPFVCPATRPACYDLAINADASCLNRVRTKTTWAAKIQDYKAYEAAEHSVKVFIETVVQNMWICNLCNPETFYSNITALPLFNHLRECSSGLHALDMVLLTIQMSQYYEGMSDISKYIFLLEDAQRKAARARLPVTDQTLTVLASTALLAANTFPCTTELWEDLDPSNKTWAAWNLAAHKKRANHFCATGGADNLGQANQPTPTPSTLASSTPSTMPWTDSPALPPTKRLSLSSSLPLTPHLSPPTPPSPPRTKPSVTNLRPSPGVAVGVRVAAITPTGGGGLTLEATAGPTDTVLDMVTPATPAPTPRKTTNAPPFVTTSWVAPSPTRTGHRTGPPEALGRTYQQKLRLLRPLIY